MSDYKRYLLLGDAAITERTAQRYNLDMDTDDEMVPNPQGNDPHENAEIEIEQEVIEHVPQPTFIPETSHTHYTEESDNETILNWMYEMENIMRDSDLNYKYEKITSLKDFLESPDFFEIVSTPVDKTKGEIFCMILKFSVLNGLPLTALTNLLKLINTLFRTPILPDSRYAIDKLLNPKKAEFHAMCQNCSVYLGKFEEVTSMTVCTVCNAEINLSNSSDSSYFALIDPSEQIADLLQNHEDHYEYVTENRIHRRGYISDVYDGKKYREFVRSLPEEEKHNFVTAVFNTDGACKFKCSQYSIWPIYLMINELPPHVRTTHLIVCGLIFTKKKPDMTVFLDKFVDLMNKCRIHFNGKRGERDLKVYVLSCCVDSVARAPIQGVTQYNGKFGCNWCLHPGEYHGIMKYTLRHELAKLRTHTETIDLMLQAKADNPVFGVKNPSPFINFLHFDVIEGFTPDYMHMALEGVAKQFTSYYFDVLKEDDIKLLDKKMDMITVPQQAARYCRKLSCRKDWKAREWENFVLYYSLIIFPSILNHKRMHHWLLFVEALYTLLKDNIHIDELNEADRILHQFVAEVEELYSVKEMTYNVHLLLHICKSVLNWGPLWTNSTFCFESANHYLLRAIKCAKGVTHQVIRFVNINHSLLVIEERITRQANDDVLVYCNDILLPKMKNVTVSNELLYFWPFEGYDDILNSLQLSKNSTEFFYKVVKDRCVYESHFKSKTRSNNSFALLKDGKFIRIVAFLISKEGGVEMTICNYLQTNQSFERAYNVFQEIQRIDAENVIIPTKSIDKICVFINVGKMYVCPMPNLYHY